MRPRVETAFLAVSPENREPITQNRETVRECRLYGEGVGVGFGAPKSSA